MVSAVVVEVMVALPLHYRERFPDCFRAYINANTFYRIPRIKVGFNAGLLAGQEELAAFHFIFGITGAIMDAMIHNVFNAKAAKCLRGEPFI